ncbi:MAG: HAD family hydrolase, a [Candidatus Kapaibacterium sp.]|nr:MAG: HAD family hydrolase, a [Candidatus Kapabacteria bacterium]
MIEFEVPGLRKFQLKNLVLDYNGTIAFDGELIPGVEKLLSELSKQLKIYIVTADTFNKVKDFQNLIEAEVHILPPEDQIKLKADFVEILGQDSTVVIGNGANDSKMLKVSALGIAVIGKEGASSKTLQNADIVCNSIEDALNLLLNPKLIIATLRQ